MTGVKGWAEMGHTVHVGRQPIVDRAAAMIGYELLHRDGTANRAGFVHQDDATRAVVDAVLGVWGMDELVGEHAAFVNVSNAFLGEEAYRDLPPDRVVLELVETDDLGPEATRAAMVARAAGYRLALDDVVESIGLLGWPVAPMLDYVKVDVLAVAWVRLPSLVRELRTLAPRAALIAEKVESAEVMRLCSTLGFDLYQGYHVSMPEVLMRRRAA